MSKVKITRSQLRRAISESLSEGRDKHADFTLSEAELDEIIRKVGAKKYRVYSKKKNPKTGKRRNLGTFSSKKAARKRERDIEFFKRQG